MAIYLVNIRMGIGLYGNRIAHLPDVYLDNALNI